jgi:protein SCO1/2
MTDIVDRGIKTDGLPTPRGLAWWQWAAMAAVIVAGVAVAFTLFRPHRFAGTVLQAPIPAASLDGLSFSNGEPASLDAFDDKLVLMYFGYTNCPDICPVTLASAARAREAMGPAGDDVQVLMVTVDPARDSLELLGEYVGYFDSTFLGVGGPEEDLDRVATLYGIYVNRGEGTPESGYTVDHTGSLMAIDRDGFLRVLYTHDVDSDALAADLEQLLG